MHRGYDRLRQINVPKSPSTLTFTPNPAFNDYLKIHKVLVGPGTAMELINIADSLDKDILPEYLAAAGSAYCEAALAQEDAETVERMLLLDRAEASWSRALDIQLGHIDSSAHIIDPADPFRTALSLARLPLIRGIVAGDVTQHTRDEVRQETLAIAAANNVRAKLAQLDGENETAWSHMGFGHELNFLIATDSLDSPTYVGVQSFARSDSGHFYPHQTHDIMLIQQKWGKIIDILPVEIKAKADKRARNRYSALLIRGKMHLTYNVGIHEPENMRRAFCGLHIGTLTRQEQRATREIRTTLLEMIHLYKSGEVMGRIATGRSLLRFRDQAALHNEYPEVAGDLVLSN